MLIVSHSVRLPYFISQHVLAGNRVDQLLEEFVFAGQRVDRANLDLNRSGSRTEFFTQCGGQAAFKLEGRLTGRAVEGQAGVGAHLAGQGNNRQRFGRRKVGRRQEEKNWE